MQKSNLWLSLMIPAAVILITANPAFSAQAVGIKQTAVKFLITMGGVALSSFIIFAGLSVYNKFFVEKNFNKSDKDDSLSTPDNTDEAITFFIKKNKLR